MAWLSSIIFHVFVLATIGAWIPHLPHLSSADTFHLALILQEPLPFLREGEAPRTVLTETQPANTQPGEEVGRSAFAREIFQASMVESRNAESSLKSIFEPEEIPSAQNLLSGELKAKPSPIAEQTFRESPLQSQIAETVYPVNENTPVIGPPSQEKPLEPLGPSSLVAVQTSVVPPSNKVREEPVPHSLQQDSKGEPPVSLQTATRSVSSDYGWLQRAILLRLEELKQEFRPSIPHFGTVRVILRAAITDKGELEELTIGTSSGYLNLDQEAMKLVYKAFPLPLEQPLGKPHVVMRIPISFSPG